MIITKESQITPKLCLPRIRCTEGRHYATTVHMSKIKEYNICEKGRTKLTNYNQIKNLVLQVTINQ